MYKIVRIMHYKIKILQTNQDIQINSHNALIVKFYSQQICEDLAAVQMTNHGAALAEIR